MILGSINFLNNPPSFGRRNSCTIIYFSDGTRSLHIRWLKWIWLLFLAYHFNVYFSETFYGCGKISVNELHVFITHICIGASNFDSRCIKYGI